MLDRDGLDGVFRPPQPLPMATPVPRPKAKTPRPLPAPILIRREIRAVAPRVVRRPAPVVVVAPADTTQLVRPPMPHGRIAIVACVLALVGGAVAWTGVHATPTQAAAPPEIHLPPVPVKPLVEPLPLELPFPARFSFNDSQPVVDDNGLATLAHQLAGCRRILFVGHSCGKGPERVNRQIGYERAVAARTAMAAIGFDPERIRVDSAGSSEPLEPNTTARGRAANRRVAVICQPEVPRD